jgi:uncharacterized membrane protein (DUF373 family)
MDEFVRWLNRAITAIEVLVVIALVAVAAGALVSLGVEMWHVAGSGPALSRAEFNLIIGTVLEIFILVELFRIAIAYMRHQNVIPTVLEAALVAVARKFVVFEGAGDYLFTALGMSALLLAVATSWLILTRTGACTLEDH